MTYYSPQIKHVPYIPSWERQFSNNMDRAIDNAKHDYNTLRVDQAMDHANLKKLTWNEQQLILKLTRDLTKDGIMSKADADTIIHLLNEKTEGSLNDFLARQQWPYPNIDIGQMPGNPWSNYFIGQLSAQTVYGHEGYQPSNINPMTKPIFNNPALDMGYVPPSPIADARFNRAVNSLLDTATTYWGDNEWAGALRGAFNNADLSKLNYQERSELLSMLGVAVADRGVNYQEASIILNRLNQALAPNFPPLPPVVRPDLNWSVEHSGNGRATIDLGNYELQLNEHRSQFILKNKQTGEETKVYGDPHMDFKNDGKNDVDFYKTITLNLEDGTKITVDTTPSKHHRGQTLSTKLTITNGDKAIVVTGLDSNKRGDLKISSSDNGRYLDRITHDGLDLYEDTKGGQSWLVQDGFNFRQVTQQDMDEANKPDIRPTPRIPQHWWR